MHTLLKRSSELDLFIHPSSLTLYTYPSYLLLVILLVEIASVFCIQTDVHNIYYVTETQLSP